MGLPELKKILASSAIVFISYLFFGYFIKFEMFPSLFAVFEFSIEPYLVALFIAIFGSYLLGVRGFKQTSIVFMLAALLLAPAVYVVSLLQNNNISIGSYFIVSIGMFVLIFAVRAMILRKNTLLALLMFLFAFIVWPSYQNTNIPEIPLFLVLSSMVLVPFAVSALTGYGLGVLVVRVILRNPETSIQPERKVVVSKFGAKRSEGPAQVGMLVPKIIGALLFGFILLIMRVFLFFCLLWVGSLFTLLSQVPFWVAWPVSAILPTLLLAMLWFKTLPNTDYIKDGIIIGVTWLLVSYSLSLTFLIRGTVPKFTIDALVVGILIADLIIPIITVTFGYRLALKNRIANTKIIKEVGSSPGS